MMSTPQKYRVPRYDLDSSLEVAEKILEHGGEASNDILAALLEYKSANNGAYMSRVAAAKLFGLIEGQGPSLRATRRARDAIEPVDEPGKKRALLDAFLEVPLFREYLAAHEGRPLTHPTGMDNDLVNNFGVSRELAAMARARLISSAEMAGLFDVAPDRLIRPRLSPSGSQPREEQPPTPAPVPAYTPESGSAPRYPKLIEGILENLRDDWTEDEFEEWMTLMRLAVRQIYRPRRASSDDQPRNSAGQELTPQG